MKILNLYAGIGGNRKLWGDEHEITSVEYNPEIAEIYRKLHPNDTLIVGDAVKYLLEHFKEYDFIWASPPCPTHSRMRLLCNEQEGKKAKLPDMTLYSIIIFLKHFFKGKYVVENVISYYEPLIKPFEAGNHYFWSNFVIPKFKDTKRGIIRHDIKFVSDNIGYDLSDFGLTKTLERKVLNNCVKPQLALDIFNAAYKNKQKTLEF